MPTSARNEAALALAKARMEKMTLDAPFDGVVGLREVSIGEFVEAGDEIVNVEQVDPLKVDFRVAEKFLAAVREGQAVASRSTPSAASVRRRGVCDRPAGRPGGRSVVIRARCPTRRLRCAPACSPASS